MPIFEYRCRGCGAQFEQLVRTGDVPACPACRGADLDKLPSHAGISTAAIRQGNVQKKKLAARRGVLRDQHMAEIDEIREHCGPEAVKGPTKS